MRLVRACLLTTALGLALAAPAGASTLALTDITPPEYQDYCGPDYRVDYTAVPGESNRVDAAFTQGEYSPAVPSPGPVCWQISPDVATLSDAGAKVTARGTCRNLSVKVGQCSANNLVEYRIHTGDGRDVIHVSLEWPPGTVIAGNGNDSVNTFNGQLDFISCGAGNDGATADFGDSVAADCEQVTLY
jgi:hypothetical protein